MYKFLLFLLLFSISSAGTKINFVFTHVNTGNGLSQNTIKGIVQDDMGFMWIGTEDGLNLYDGYNCRIFKTDPLAENSISDNFITAMVKDSKGYIWIGTNSGGVNKLDPLTGIFTVFKNSQVDENSLSINNVWSLAVDKKDNIWVGLGQGGLNKINSYTGIVERIDLGLPVNMTVLSVTIDKSDRIIIGTENYGLYVYDPNSKKALSGESHGIPSNSIVSAVLCDSRGILWVGTADGLFKMERGLKTPEYYSVYNKEKGLPTNYVRTIMEDSRGRIWIGTVGGITLITETDEVVLIRNTEQNFASLSNNYIWTIYQDKNGIIWIGTKTGGINKLNGRKSGFIQYTAGTDGGSGLSDNTIRTIFQERTGRLWAGTLNFGLNLYDPSSDSFVKYDYTKYGSEVSHNYIIALAQDFKDNLWIGTWGSGVQVTHAKGDVRSLKFEKVLSLKHNPSNASSLTSDFIQAIFQDRQNNMWIGTENGLNKYDPANGRITRYVKTVNPKSLCDNRVQSNCIVEDYYGNIWIGTWNGISRLDYQDGTASPEFTEITADQKGTQLFEKRIISMLPYKQDILWLGTHGGGLCKLELTDKGKTVKSIKYYSFAHGIPNDVVYGIKADKEGYLWLSTNSGLSRFNPVKETFLNFNSSDGLATEQFFWGAAARTIDGKIYFGSVKGLTGFDPLNVGLNRNIPAVVIKKVRIADRIFSSDNWIKEDTEIEISHKENNFSLEFAALDYTAPEKNQYAYKLEGYDKEWIYCGNRRYVSYTNLDGGLYTFRVKASNNHGIWNEEGTSIQIIVVPPFYKTTWFYILMVIIGTGLIIGLVKIRTRHMEQRNKELKEEIVRRRESEEALKIARKKAEESDRLKSDFLAQMSHEIRTPINTLLSFSWILRDEFEEHLTPEHEEIFSTMKRAGNRIVRTIDMILNMSQIETNTYELVPRVFDLYEKALLPSCKDLNQKAKDNGLTLEIINKEKENFIEADEYMIGQLFYNLLDNAIKYTKEGGVTVTIIHQNEDILVKISDTGIGISDEYLPRLFDPFTQEETGYTRKYEGNGLGLSLVKKYSEMNNVRIEVKSKKNVGTEFTVIFKKHIVKPEN